MEPLVNKRLGTMDTESNPGKDMQIVYSEKDVEESVKNLREMLKCSFEYPDDRFIEVIINRSFGEGFALSENSE